MAQTVFILLEEDGDGCFSRYVRASLHKEVLVDEAKKMVMDKNYLKIHYPDLSINRVDERVSDSGDIWVGFYYGYEKGENNQYVRTLSLNKYFQDFYVIQEEELLG